VQTEVLGVEIGGVIIDRINDKTDTSFFSENYLQTTAVPGVVESRRQLVEKRFGEHVYLVSKCGPKVEAKSLHWLDHHHFHQMSGVPSGNIRFCRERHENAGICRKLGITHFVDDRLEVLSHLTTVGKLFLFRPQPDEARRFAQHLDRVQQVDSWQDIQKELLA
jgi:hypothetical protein